MQWSAIWSKAGVAGEKAGLRTLASTAEGIAAVACLGSAGER